MTSKTVQCWQKEFAQKRFGIFPEGLSVADPMLTLVAHPEAEEKAETASKPAKARKAKKEKKPGRGQAKINREGG